MSTESESEHEPALLPPWDALLQQLPAHTLAHGQCYFADSRRTSNSLGPQLQMGLLQISGPDLDRFLQGQLTADVEKLGNGGTVLAAHCDPKGRMHANFLLSRLDASTVIATLPRNNVANALAALQKYAVFSKVSIDEKSADYAAFTGRGIEALSQQVDGGLKVALNTQPGIDALLWVPTSQLTTKPDIVSSVDWQNSDDWQQQRFDAGVAFISAATSGEIIPQMLNLDELGGISFDKGCYTGQEVIARLKYRGEVKRRCYRFCANDERGGALAAGTQLHTAAGQSAGLIVEVMRTDIAVQGLAVVKTSAAGAGSSELFATINNDRIPLQFDF